MSYQLYGWKPDNNSSGFPFFLVFLAALVSAFVVVFLAR